MIRNIHLYLSFTLIAPLNSQVPIPSLSQLTNFHLYLDSYHLLWMSSTDGLNCYNGQTTKTYNSSDYNLLGANIQSGFIEDKQSNLWFTTYQALHVYDRHKGEFSYFQLEIHSGSVISKGYKIVLKEEGKILLTAGEYLVYFDLCSRSFSQRLELDLSHYNLRYTAKVYKDTIFLMATNLNETIFTALSKDLTGILKEPSPYPLTNSKLAGGKGGIIATDGKGKIYLKRSINSELELIYNIRETIFDLRVSDNDELLLLLNNKLIRLDKNLEQIESTPISIPGNLLCLLEGTNKNYWVSSDGNGVFSFMEKPQKFRHLHHIDNNIVINPNGIMQDSKNNYWYCTRREGITKLDSELNLIDGFSDRDKSFPFDYIYKMDIDSRDNLYVSTFESLVVYEDEKFTTLESGLGEIGVYGIKVTKNDKLLFVTAQKGGLYEMELGNENFSTVNPASMDSIPLDYMTTILETKDGGLIIGVNAESISIYSELAGEYYFQKDHNLNSDIKSVWEFPESNDVYISSSSGLFYFAEGLMGKMEKVKDENNLLDQCIYEILGDKKFLWLSSNQGLIRFDTTDGSTKQFTEADGVQGMEFNTGASWIDHKGQLLFGGTNGINIFHPDSVTLSNYQALIHLSEIRVNDETYISDTNVSVLETLGLEYENNTVSFIFNGIDHTDPESIKLRYKLEGVDKNWVTLIHNDGFARYPNLKPGNYTLLLNSSNADAIWSDRIKKIALSIYPPYWQTWWFRAVVLSLIGMVIWLSFKAYYKRKLEKKNVELREQQLLLEKQEALQTERNRIAAEMHDDLGGGLTTIKFVSQRAMRNIEEPKEKALLQKIVNQSDTLVTNMSEIIWAMNSKFDNLESTIAYMRRYAMEYLKDFDIELDFSSGEEINEVSLTSTIRRNLLLVLKEALNNVVKHSEASKVSIRIEEKNETLYFTIADNGQGFSQQKVFGNGLNNMKERVKMISGKLNYLSSEGGLIIEVTLPTTML